MVTNKCFLHIFQNRKFVLELKRAKVCFLICGFCFCFCDHSVLASAMLGLQACISVPARFYTMDLARKVKSIGKMVS
jgi:hypothetical protein